MYLRGTRHLRCCNFGLHRSPGNRKGVKALGFGGFAATRGRLDGAITKDEVLAHCSEMAAAVPVPVSADLENCFADALQGRRPTGTWPVPPAGTCKLQAAFVES